VKIIQNFRMYLIHKGKKIEMHLNHEEFTQMGTISNGVNISILNRIYSIFLIIHTNIKLSYLDKILHLLKIDLSIYISRDEKYIFQTLFF
jgi:hypothetical protein